MSFRKVASMASQHERLIDCLWIGAAFAIPVVLLRPFDNHPFVDDWVYAWAVERLLEHGDLRILSFSYSINPLQTLWGALFSLVLGFSFTALRCSTWVASVLCLSGFYVLLRDVGVSRRDSLIGTALLACHPMFFILSFTFMTDVPFLALLVWYCVALARAVRLRSDGWLLVSSLLACAAMAIRMEAVLLPGIILLVLLFDEARWGRSVARMSAAVVPVLFAGLLYWWYQSHQFQPVKFWQSPGAQVDVLLRRSLPLFPGMLLSSVTFTAGALGVGLLPIVAASVSRADLRKAFVALLVLSGALAGQILAGREVQLPLERSSLWSLLDIGGSRSMVIGDFAASPVLRGHWSYVAGMLVLGAASLSILWRRPTRSDPKCLPWWLLARVVFAAAVWMIWDRYALVFVPVAAAWMLAGRPIARPAVAVALVSVFAAHAFVGTRDDLVYNRALWSAVGHLRQRGVPDAEIGGGYVVNGWLQYAHPENALRMENGELAVAWITTDRRLPYAVANAPLDGWRVIHRVPYRGWLTGPAAVYALENASPPASGSR